MADELGVVTEDDVYDSLLRWHYTKQNDILVGKTETYQLKRTLFTLKAKPAFSEASKPMLVSIPQYSFLTDRNIDNIALMNVLIWVENAEENRSLIDEIATDLRRSLLSENEIRVTYIDEDNNANVMKIIDIIFYVTIGIMMFLCFFSLVASMTANLLDQSKEIGVMRSIGITSRRIKLLYFYEALILVLSSCLLGVMIGMTVGYTMALQ